eukprot:5755211-Alexandrium_andersonii.AAC.1
MAGLSARVLVFARTSHDRVNSCLEWFTACLSTMPGWPQCTKAGALSVMSTALVSRENFLSSTDSH